MLGVVKFSYLPESRPWDAPISVKRNGGYGRKFLLGTVAFCFFVFSANTAVSMGILVDNYPNLPFPSQNKSQFQESEREYISRVMEVPLSSLNYAQVAQTATTTLPLRPSTAAPRASLPQEIEIVIPFSERGNYIGDLPVKMRGDTPYFEAKRIAELLKEYVSPSAQERLKALGNGERISIEELKASGLVASWDPGLLAIDVIVSASDKNAREIEIAELERTDRGQFVQPAKFALYTNFRTSFDYQHMGLSKGMRDPFVDANLGGRILGVAFENEINYDTGGFGLRRNASRLVFDDEKRAIRMTLGDVRPQVRGYQSGNEILGVSVFSAYQSIQPLRNLRPRGEGSFSLNDPSNVDIVINGRVVRRMYLDSGAYNLKDFPFLDGQNRVSFIVEDRTGRRELAKFDVFFDRELLAPKLTEWALTAGSTSFRGIRGPEYSDGKFYASGFYRRGVTSAITMGGNLQIEGSSGIIGWEAVWGTKLGAISWDLAQSASKNGNGTALNLSIQQTSNNGLESKRNSYGLAISAKTIDFGSNDSFNANNTEAAAISTFWSRNLNEVSSVSADASYNISRAGLDNTWSARLGYSRRISGRVGMNADISYNNSRFGDDFAFRIQLTARFGNNGTLSSSFDSRDERFAANVQRSGQSQYGAWSVNGDIDRSRLSSGINAGAFLAANRGEIGLAHSTSFDADFGNKSDERTSLRFAGAIGFADGAIAFGKPIYGSFAIAKPHRSLVGRKVIVDGETGSAASKLFGPALIGNIPNYSRRDLNVDVEDLPVGYDLGTGTISVRAPYNAGYKLIVGSDDNLTVIARALNEDGEPIAFIAGKAKRASDGKEIEFFTNARGIFSATGMGPGQWNAVLNTSPDPTKISFDLPNQGGAMRRLGDIKGEVE